MFESDLPFTGWRFCGPVVLEVKNKISFETNSTKKQREKSLQTNKFDGVSRTERRNVVRFQTQIADLFVFTKEKESRTRK